MVSKHHVACIKSGETQVGNVFPSLGNGLLCLVVGGEYAASAFASIALDPISMLIRSVIASMITP